MIKNNRTGLISRSVRMVALALIASSIVSGCAKKTQFEGISSGVEAKPIFGEALISPPRHLVSQSLAVLQGTGYQVEDLGVGVLYVTGAGVSFEVLKNQLSKIEALSDETVVEGNFPLVQSRPQVGTPTSLTPKHYFTLDKTQDNAIPNLLRNPIQNKAIGDDPLARDQWNLQAVGAFGATLDDQSFARLRSIVVAVIDSGVDYNHEDLRDAIFINRNEISNNGIDDDRNGYVDDVVGYDFGDNDPFPYDPINIQYGDVGHGTHCAGVVGAINGNGVGISSVGSGVQILPVKIFGMNGNLAVMIKAIKYSTDMGAHILTNSWGLARLLPPDLEPLVGLKRAVEYVGLQGRIFVAASGNGDQQGIGMNLDTEVLEIDGVTIPVTNLPSGFDFPHVVAVASTMESGNLSTFSNYGRREVDIAAPGDVILSTVPGSRYADGLHIKFKDQSGAIQESFDPWSGTSMATPMVSGLLARLIAQNPSMNHIQVIELLRISSKSVPELQPYLAWGGIISLR